MRYTPISELYRQVRERKLTPQEIEDREKIAKKLPIKDFEKRYGKEKGMQVKMATATNIVKAKSEVKEDGHQDVASAIRQCKTVTEDAMQILQKLKSMSPEDSLPSWWTNKLAVASNSMNKLRDYFLVPSVSEEVELNEAEVSVYGFISTGARKKFLDNLNDMRLQFKSKVMNLPQPAPPSGVLKFDANQSTIEAIIKFAKRMKLKIMEEKIGEELDKDDESTVKKVVAKLKKASQAHADQAKTLTKDLQDETDLNENFRKLAMMGIGTETKKGARVGLTTDYYLPSNGDKSTGKIIRVSKDGYEIENDGDLTPRLKGKRHKFKFYDPTSDKTSVRGMRKENYEIGNDYAKHTLRVTPGQLESDVDDMLGIAQKKNLSMRETLAKLWGMTESKNPFEKKVNEKEDEMVKKVTKTMTGKKPTPVEVNPKTGE